MPLLLSLACTGQSVDDTGEVPLPAPLTADQLADELGSDLYAGRTPGSLGHTAALEWLEVAMAAAGLRDSSRIRGRCCPVTSGLKLTCQQGHPHLWRTARGLDGAAI